VCCKARAAVGTVDSRTRHVAGGKPDLHSSLKCEVGIAGIARQAARQPLQVDQCFVERALRKQRVDRVETAGRRVARLAGEEGIALLGAHHRLGMTSKSGYRNCTERDWTGASPGQGRFNSRCWQALQLPAPISLAENSCQLARPLTWQGPELRI
jgi:hypothetical protein